MSDKIQGFRHMCLACDFDMIPWEEIAISTEEKEISRSELRVEFNQIMRSKVEKTIRRTETTRVVEQEILFTWPALNDELTRVGIDEAKWNEGVRTLDARGDASDWGCFVWHEGKPCLRYRPDHNTEEPQTWELWEALGLPTE